MRTLLERMRDILRFPLCKYLCTSALSALLFISTRRVSVLRKIVRTLFRASAIPVRSLFRAMTISALRSSTFLTIARDITLKVFTSLGFTETVDRRSLLNIDFSDIGHIAPTLLLNPPLYAEMMCSTNALYSLE